MLRWFHLIVQLIIRRVESGSLQPIPVVSVLPVSPSESS